MLQAKELLWAKFQMLWKMLLEDTQPKTGRFIGMFPDQQTIRTRAPVPVADDSDLFAGQGSGNSFFTEQTVHQDQIVVTQCMIFGESHRRGGLGPDHFLRRSSASSG